MWVRGWWVVGAGFCRCEVVLWGAALRALAALGPLRCCYAARCSGTLAGFAGPGSFAGIGGLALALWLCSGCVLGTWTQSPGAAGAESSFGRLLLVLHQRKGTTSGRPGSCRASYARTTQILAIAMT